MQDGTPDNELLTLYARNGSEAAFALLVSRHVSLVFGAALRQTRDPAQAEEVAQKVFVTLARRAPLLLGHGSLAGWLYKTALLQARELGRAEDRRRRREQTAAELGTTMKSNDATLAELAPELDEVIEKLRPGEREAVLLRFFAQKSLREVGEALGIQEDAARKRVGQAVASLTAGFRRRGFRVATPALVALALTKASAAAPAGLAASVTQGAVAAGASGVVGKWAVPLVKFMTLTKIQTAALCLAVAAAPLGYQWHSIQQARAAHELLARRAAALRGEADEREAARQAAEARVVEAERLLAAPAPVVGRIPAPPAAAATNLFAWDESSPYVRLPKSLLSQVKVGAYETRLGRDGKPERWQLPPLGADGAPQASLGAALGLSPDESAQLATLCQKTFADFQVLASAHGTLQEEPLPDGVKERLETRPFPEDGAALRDQFRQQLDALLGPDKASAFWTQAEPVFQDYLNDFGARPHEYELFHRQNQPLELMEAYRDTHRIGVLADQGPKLLPPQLQSYVSQWSAPVENGAPPQ